MTCLKDIQIQALADGEGGADDRRHAVECPRCAARLHERRLLMTSVQQALDPPVTVPAALAGRVDEIFRLKADAAQKGHGATRLRVEQRGSRRLMYSGLAVAAATLVAVLVVAPMMKSTTTVSAAEILAKSADALSAPVSSGIEILEYELVLEGVPKEMLADQVDGTYKVWQAIDHDVPGRFRFASYTSDGRMLTSIAEDPLAKRRVASFPSEGQPYRFEMSLPANATNMSLPELQRLHMQASITMMQASGNQLLETIDGPRGKLYRIETPHAAGPGTSPLWDLTEGRVLIDATDYSIVEFAVRGTFFKQSYSMSYKLIHHTFAAAVPPDAFAVPRQAGEIVVAGEGTTLPTHDIVVLALRELTRVKRGQ